MKDSRGIIDLLAALPVAAFLVDARGRITRVNATAHTLLGDAAAALSERPLADALPGVPGLAAIDLRSQPPEGDWAGTFKTESGEAAVLVHARRMTGDGFGSSVVVLLARPTESQAAERVVDLEARLRRLSPIRHEINNQLMGLLGHSELLRDDPALAPSFRARCESILEHCRKVDELVRQIGGLYR